MPTRILSVLGVLVASWLHGQTITLPAQPIAPGSTIAVTVFNNTGAPLDLPCGSALWMQQSDGSPILYPASNPCGSTLPPGGTLTEPFVLPATGPGSNGSFVFRSHLAAIRIDVGSPSPGFTTIHANPYRISHNWLGHGVDFGGSEPSWEISNTSLLPHTFGAGDVVTIHAPGSSTALVTAALAGITVPPQLTIVGTLPLSTLGYGPYTVVMSWLDPGTNTMASLSHGIVEYGPDVDLRLKGGHLVPIGGSIPVEFAITSFPYLLPTDYAVCLGVAPGSTSVGPYTIPLVLDFLVMASLTDGIGGLLVNNVGTAPPSFAKWEPAIISGITIQHHGVPGLSGVVVRAAAMAHQPISGYFGASQAENLIFQ
jgi:hypothetical protein